MAEIYAVSNPEQRIYVGGVSVKFREGVAEVPDELAEILLQRDGFSASPDGDTAPDDSEIEAEVEARLEVEVARITAEAEEKIGAEVERVTAETEAKIEAEVERRVTDALAAANPVSTDEAPAKRGPGRPKKTEPAE